MIFSEQGNNKSKGISIQALNPVTFCAGDCRYPYLQLNRVTPVIVKCNFVQGLACCECVIFISIP